MIFCFDSINLQNVSLMIANGTYYQHILNRSITIASVLLILRWSELPAQRKVVNLSDTIVSKIIFFAHDCSIMIFAMNIAKFYV